MLIHFIGAVKGNQARYHQVLAVIKSLGHKVITAHSATRKLSDIENETESEAIDYTKKALNWIKKADIVIVEASYDDISIGFEATVALQHATPVIFLYEKKAAHPPFSMKGYDSSRIQLIEYTLETLTTDLKHALSYASEQLDIRFNLLLSPKLMGYLATSCQSRTSPQICLYSQLAKRAPNQI